MKGVLQRARQSLGNTVDRVGTALNLPERNLSEWWAGKQTTFTGTTPQSQNAGFIRNTGGDRALNTRSTNPETMRQVQQQMSRNIQGQPPAPASTPSLAEWNRRQQQAQTKQNTGGAGGLGMGGVGGGSSVDAEEARLRAEQEAKNEQFRQRLGSEYGDIRNRFGNIISTFEGKMRDLPNTIRQLSEQYKSTLGGKQEQELGQIEQKRQQVQAQQKAGLIKWPTKNWAKPSPIG